jgi:hypothetical protein
MTYELIDSVTLGSATSSVTFGSIPQTFRDLVIIGTPIKDSATTNIYFRFNSDTGSNYNYTFMGSNGSSKNFGSSTNQDTYQLSNVGVVRFDNAAFSSTIMDYTQTDKHKSGVTRVGSDNRDNAEAGAFRWADTSAISTLLIYADATMDAGSNFQLFGIAG